MKITINLPPKTKKNSQRILQGRNGQRFIAPSAAYMKYEKDACWLIRNAVPAFIDYPVNVKCLYFMPTARKVDLTNLLEATDDILVKAGILEDDNCTIIAGHDGSRVFIDRENPRTEIEIERIEQ